MSPFFGIFILPSYHQNRPMLKKISLVFILCSIACSEKPKKSEQSAIDNQNKVAQFFAEMEARALEQPYHGIFTEEGEPEGLFPIFSTGVSTKPIVESAVAFIGILSNEQRQKILFPIDDPEWRKWSNVDNGIYKRQGMSLKMMDTAQKKAAFKLLQASLSAKGLQLSKDIMKTDQTLRELNDNSADYDENLYFFTIMGEPSATAPWGWQLDGHHLVINYFVMGDQIVMSPVFMGAEPVLTTTGKYKGNTLFQDEQNLGLGLMRSLDDAQRKKAIIATRKVQNNNVAAANKDNLTLNYQGLSVSEFNEGQKETLLHLIDQYVANMREGHHDIKMEEVSQYLNQTSFAWVGDTSENAVFYYRIHSPVLLIEFDHQIAVGIPGANKEVPTRNHIHTVVRTPNGNDYGKRLLEQHLEAHHR